MKFLNRICLLGALLLAGCGNAGQGEDDKGGATLRSGDGGSVVGNGLVSYKNELLQVSFEYPGEWELQESPDREAVSLSNAPLNPGGAPSMIAFQRLKELNGKRIFSQEELQAALKKLDPAANWKPAEFVGHRRGFVSRTIESGGRLTRAQYYVLDENYNILWVKYQAMQDFGGEDIVYAVLGSVVIDLDPPEVFDVRVEPARARPGDEVRVTIVAVDDASGINGNYFVRPMVDLANMRQNWLGYDVKHTPYDVKFEQAPPEAWWMHSVSPGVKKGYEPAAAFPFREGWSRVSKIRYTYRFRVPKNAPRGKVVLANLSLSDVRGNEVVYTLEPETDERKIAPTSYLGTYQIRRERANGNPYRMPSSLKAVSFEVAGESTMGENAGIEVQDMFWDTSLIRAPSWGMISNPLFVRARSQGTVVAAFLDVPKILGPGCIVKEYYWDYRLSQEPSLGGTHPTVSMEGAGLLRLSREIYVGQGQCGDARFSSTMLVRRLYLRDDLGNIISIGQAKLDSYESGDMSLPIPGRPVIFQATW